MFSYVLFICLFLLSLKLSSSHSVNASSPQWLPKCCPKGKQISSDGKSCVVNYMGNLEYNFADDKNSSADTLSVFVDNETVHYKLEHRTQFNCLRHELFVVHDDIYVTADGSVVVIDDFGETWNLSSTELCVDSVFLPPTMGLIPDRVFVALLCPSCEKIPCIHKCCPESQRLDIREGGTIVNCVDSVGPSWSEEFLENSAKRPFVMHGFPECSNSPYLDYPEDPLKFSDHGHLVLPGGTVPRAEYCADSLARGSALLACRQTPLAGSLKPTLYGGLFCLGAVFLAITLGLHLWLPELRKTLHSRVLIAHIACLTAGYVGLAVANLAPLSGPSPLCSTTAFFIQFTILASIFWLNIMCVDIAWTFSGLRPPKGSLTLDSDGHKFLYYSLYSWGSTAVVSGITAFLEYSPLIPPSSRLKPAFGASRCWFQYSESILLLVYGPMGLLLLTNIILFVYTAYKIQCTQRDTANLVQHGGARLRENKDRFTLYLKLFGLMGVTWVLEVVSWLVGGPESYWYITDALNALRSVFIFALFCLKKKVYVLIKDKLTHKKKPRFPIHPRKSNSSSKMSSSMTSQRTNSLQLSQIS